MNLVAYVFYKLQIVKGKIRQMSKWPRFIIPFHGQQVKGSQKLVESPGEYFDQIFLSLWGTLTWKTSILVIFELLQLFVKTLTGDGKYSLCNI